MNKLKLYLVRRWVHLMPIGELRDEIFRQAVDKWFNESASLMLRLFETEYPPENEKRC